ncbi:hypothetical protein HZZ13_00915 [Bradyrhizobium sp. CNPSo 4010]|uniref:Uncharacterized protein n=1 Tax=Bradyrhizobium agreste TaxID=2751811 RepID=A0ABS0PHG8_9BRAD|nr:hypothetical protein [Bradyrhizobium agreste]MBH5396377.1 hypothetical protein [Bradyrhizobium agreste]
MLEVVESLPVNAKRNLQIPIVLSGDTHHYSRYSGNDGVTQFITSGGGAFLRPTHQLEDNVVLDPKDDNKSWLGRRVTELKLKTKPDSPHEDCEAAACYPSRTESLELLKGNFSFVSLNPGFCFLRGAIYWPAGLATVHLWPDSLVLVPLLFGLGFWAYTKRQEGNSRVVQLISAANGAVHSTVAILAAQLFDYLSGLASAVWRLALAGHRCLPRRDDARRRIARGLLLRNLPVPHVSPLQDEPQ